MKKYIFLFFLMIVSSLTAQDFTQISVGDIVNDGGWNYACCWADFTGDGFDDLFVCNNDADSGKHNFLYYNNGNSTFTKITEGDIITDGNSSYGCAAADYDNDGDLDLFVSNYNENNCLYNNNGDGTFTKVTTGNIVNNSGKSTGCEWIDYDKDGWLDLFICNRDEPNFLYNNNEDGTFTRITTGLIATESKNSGNCCWADYDGNGYPDLFVANSGPDYNSLFLNNGDGTFSQVTNDPIVSDLESFDICCTGDIDNDGDFDVFTAPGMLPASAYDIYLYQNNGDGSFVRIPNLPHAGINMGGGCTMIDYDNDGDLDIFESAYDGGSILLQNDGTGDFTQITTGALVNSGSYNKEPSWTDFDQDGDLDVFLAVNNYFGGNNKFFSNNGNADNWLFLDLEGSTSNYNGIDALISVTVNINGQDVTQTKRVSARNSLTSHFGLGDAAIIDEIVVTWPSGEITALEEIAINLHLLIPETPFIIPPPENVQVDEETALMTWEEPATTLELVGYLIYLDSELISWTTELEHQYSDLVIGQTYLAGVSASYDFPPVVSEIIETEFTFNPIVFNPPQNFEIVQEYIMPDNYYHLYWNDPEPCYPTLSYYNIYANYEVYCTADSSQNTITLIDVPGNINAEILFYMTAVYENPFGESVPTDSILCGIALSAQDIIHKNDALSNYPNPFNPETTITFSTTNLHKLTQIEIYNLKGQKIKQLVSDQLLAGQHSVIWNGTDESGKAVSSGVYLCKMKSGDYQNTRKMILMK